MAMASVQGPIGGALFVAGTGLYALGSPVLGALGWKRADPRAVPTNPARTEALERARRDAAIATGAALLLVATVLLYEGVTS